MSALTPLMFAAFRGDNLDLQRLFDHGHSAEERDARGRTAAHYAILGGQYLNLGFLAGMGFANSPDNEGNTPLHFAARLGDMNSIHLLLQVRVNQTLLNATGEDAIAYA